MIVLLGLAFTMAMVFGGYVLAGGKLGIILHALPFEGMMIGGAAIGAFLAANSLSTLKQTGGDLIAAFKGPKWKKQDYQDLLCLLHQLITVMKESPVDIERHIEEPEASDLFAKYPRIQQDHHAVEMICDTIRSMIMNFDNAFQVEEMLEKGLVQHREHSLHGAHAMQTTADALPALGIVAAVLGVIKTMASIDKPPEVLGQMIGGALVGTFLGVFLAYGAVGPFATRIKDVREEENNFYNLIREVLVSYLHQNPSGMCIEVGRRNAPHHVRPSFNEMEEAIKQAKTAA